MNKVLNLIRAVTVPVFAVAGIMVAAMCVAAVAM